MSKHKTIYLENTKVETNEQNILYAPSNLQRCKTTGKLEDGKQTQVN